MKESRRSWNPTAEEWAIDKGYHQTRGVWRDDRGYRVDIEQAQADESEAQEQRNLEGFYG